MFHELGTFSKKLCFIVENCNFDAWVSPIISQTRPEQREHYTP